MVCTDREQLAQLAGVWRGAGQVAGSAATIALVAPVSDDARARDLVQFDLGQATMSIMLAAPASVRRGRAPRPLVAAATSTRTA